MEDVIEKWDTYSLSLFQSMSVLVKVNVFPDLYFSERYEMYYIRKMVNLLNSFLIFICILTFEICMIDIHIWMLYKAVI